MLKKFIPHIAAVVIFYLIGTIYFFPEMQGQKLIQPDMVNANARATIDNTFPADDGGHIDSRISSR